MSTAPTPLEILHAALSQAEATQRAAWDLLVKMDAERTELQERIRALEQQVRRLEELLNPPPVLPRPVLETMAQLTRARITAGAWFGVQDEDDGEG